MWHFQLTFLFLRVYEKLQVWVNYKCASRLVCLVSQAADFTEAEMVSRSIIHLVVRYASPNEITFNDNTVETLWLNAFWNQINEIFYNIEVDQTCKRFCPTSVYQSHNVVWCGAVCFFPYGPAGNMLSVGGWNTRCTLHKSEGEVTRIAAHLTV